MGGLTVGKMLEITWLTDERMLDTGGGTATVGAATGLLVVAAGGEAVGGFAAGGEAAGGEAAGGEAAG